MHRTAPHRAALRRTCRYIMTFPALKSEPWVKSSGWRLSRRKKSRCVTPYEVRTAEGREGGAGEQK